MKTAEMTSTLYLTSIFVCIYALINVGTGQDPCATIQECIQPVANFKSVTQGIPWAPEEESLCGELNSVIDCLEYASMSQCTNHDILGPGWYVAVLLTSYCVSDSGAIRNSACAKKGKERIRFKANVILTCGRGLDVNGKASDIEAGTVTDQELCNYADELHSCIITEARDNCDDRIKTALQDLLSGSVLPPETCQWKWDYTHMYYEKLITTR